MTFSFTHCNVKFITKKIKKTPFEILLLVILIVVGSPKTSYAYYAKAFKTGFVETFNVFYTRHDNNINALYTCNDIEVGFSKNLWAEFEFSFMYGHSKVNNKQAFGLNYFNFRFFFASISRRKTEHIYWHWNVYTKFICWSDWQNNVIWARNKTNFWYKHRL